MERGKRPELIRYNTGDAGHLQVALLVSGLIGMGYILQVAKHCLYDS